MQRRSMVNRKIRSCIVTASIRECLTYGGAYAEYVAVQAGTLMHKPARLSWEEAAAIPEVN